MSPTPLVLIADRYLLDSQLLEARIGRERPVASCRPEELATADLGAAALVLIDAELDPAAFTVVSDRAARVGILYDEVTSVVRERAAAPAVCLVACRLDSMNVLVKAVAAALAGEDRSALTVVRTSFSGRPELSRREREVLTLMATGMGNRDIADELSISPNTVRTHVQALLTKLDRGNRVSAVGAARAAGLLSS